MSKICPYMSVCDIRTFQPKDKWIGTFLERSLLTPNEVASLDGMAQSSVPAESHGLTLSLCVLDQIEFVSALFYGNVTSSGDSYKSKNNAHSLIMK